MSTSTWRRASPEPFGRRALTTNSVPFAASAGSGISSTDEAGANKLWAEIDKAITDEAPMAVMFNPKHVDFVSKRLGNFVFNSQFYWTVSQSWVK